MSSGASASGDGSWRDRDITLVVMHPYYPKPVNLSWTLTQEGKIRDIKALLTQEHPWKPDVADQKLIFHGRVLSDDEIVHSVFARWPADESMTLHLVTSPPPAPEPSPPPSTPSPPPLCPISTSTHSTEDSGPDDSLPRMSTGVSEDMNVESRLNHVPPDSNSPYPLYEHGQNLGEVATLAGLAGTTGVHSGTTNATLGGSASGSGFVDHGRRPVPRMVPEYALDNQQLLQFQQQMLHEMGMSRPPSWSGFDPIALAWFNEEEENWRDSQAPWNDRMNSIENFAQALGQSSRTSSNMLHPIDGASQQAGRTGSIGGDGIKPHDSLDEEDSNEEQEEPQSYEECIASFKFHYEKLMRAIELSQRVQATAARLIPMHAMGDMMPGQHYPFWGATGHAGQVSAFSAGSNFAAAQTRGGYNHSQSTHQHGQFTDYLRRHAAQRAQRDPSAHDEPRHDGEYAHRPDVQAENERHFDGDAPGAAMAAGGALGARGARGRHEAGVPVLQRVIVINVQLIIKLGLVVYFLKNDTSSVQFYMMLLGAALIYLYETGYLEPILGTREQQVAFFHRQRLHELGHIATTEQVPNGFVADTYYFFKAFVLSIIPSWNVVARADEQQEPANRAADLPADQGVEVAQ